MPKKISSLTRPSLAFMSPHAQQAQVDEALSQWTAADLPAGPQQAGRFIGAASGLSPYRQLVTASSWRQFHSFPTWHAQALQQAGRAIELSNFRRDSRLDGLHSGHCFDLPFQFGDYQAWQDAPLHQHNAVRLSSAQRPDRRTRTASVSPARPARPGHA